MAFQILDDVLDVSGPPERTGKRRGTDLLDGTVTLPLILARERDPRCPAGHALPDGSAEAEPVCDRIAATGALEKARARALQSWPRRRRRSTALDCGRTRAALGLVADSVVERYA